MSEYFTNEQKQLIIRARRIGKPSSNILIEQIFIRGNKMKTVSIEKIMKEQEKKRQDILKVYNRGTSANELALMALNHNGSGSECAAKLLISMEYGHSFDFQLLLSLDTKNRTHADIIMQGYKPHELWPSKWMDEQGLNGADIMRKIKFKWTKTERLSFN